MPRSQSGDSAAAVAKLQRRVAELERRIRATKQSADHFRTIFEHSHDAMFLIDLEADQILDANAAAEKLLGYDHKELVTMSMSSIHPDEMARVQAFAVQVMNTGHGWTEELSCLSKRGDFIGSEISASLVDYGGRRCVVASVRDVSDRKRLQGENAYLRRELDSESRHGEIIGRSPALLKTLEQALLVGPTNASVLVMGESGTGKELIARYIHAESPRSAGALVRVNCASIPQELFESEFFGHVKGAFTGAVQDRVGRFELADGGTLFLDEVGEIPLGLQSKLLRVLQEGVFERVGESRSRKTDVRVIAATNRDLTREVGEGRFREDLYYRLSVFPMEVPALRDRRGDISLLARHFLEEACRRHGRRDCEFAPAQLKNLEGRRWPGNVRELQNVIERAVITSQGRRVRVEGESAERGGATHALAADAAGESDIAYTIEDLSQLERDIIVRALEASRGKVYGEDGAAHALGMPPTTLAYRMKKLGVRRRASSPT